MGRNWIVKSFEVSQNNIFLGTVVGQGDTQTGISQLDFQCYW
jgi:hypothetical protein